MSQSRSVGPAVVVAATLPVTGSSTAMMMMVGVAVLVLGMVLVRAARLR